MCRIQEVLSTRESLSRRCIPMSTVSCSLGEVVCRKQQLRSKSVQQGTPKRGMTQWLRMIERLSAEPAQAAYIQQLEQGRPVSAALWLSETSGFTHCLRTAAFCQTQSYKSKAVKQKAKRSGAPRGPSVPRCPPPRSSQAERQRREAEEALRLVPAPGPALFVKERV